MDIAMLLGSPDGMTTAARTPHSRGPVGAGGSDRARPAAEPAAGQESGGGFRARMLARVRRGGRTGAPSTGRGAGQPGTRPAGQRRPEGAATGTEAAAAAALTLLVHGGQDADAATVVPAPGAAGGGEAGSALLEPPTAAEGEAGAGVTAGLPPFAEAGEPEIQAGPAPAGPEAGAPAATPAGGTPAGEEGGPGDSAVPGASGSAVQGDAGTGPDGAGAFPDGRGAAGAGGYAGLEAAPDPAAARAAIDGRVAAVAAADGEDGQVPAGRRAAEPAAGPAAPSWLIPQAPVAEGQTPAPGGAVDAGDPAPAAEPEAAFIPDQEGPGEAMFPVRLVHRDPDGRLAVRVDARELGAIQVDVQQAGDRLDLGLRAARPETADLLGQHLPELLAGLRGRRIDVGQASVLAGFQPAADGRAGHPSHRGDRDERPSPRSLPGAAVPGGGIGGVGEAASPARGDTAYWMTTARLDVMA